MMNRLISVLLMAGLMTGCMWSRQRLNGKYFHAKAEQVKVGETKADQLNRIFGTPPNAVVPMSEGLVYLYNFGDVKTFGFNVFVLGMRKSNAGFDSALFFVDKQGVVKDKLVSTNSKNLPWEWWPFGEE